LAHQPAAGNVKTAINSQLRMRASGNVPAAEAEKNIKNDTRMFEFSGYTCYFIANNIPWWNKEEK
jgi:hypothetical protein